MYGVDSSAEAALAAIRRVKEVAANHAEDVDRKGRFPSESVAALAQHGLYGLCVPQALGGMGQGPRTFAAVSDELARAAPRRRWCT
jgi:alkylation response protein AidB-like acyl-CoA dehydrogenase